MPDPKIQDPQKKIKQEDVERKIQEINQGTDQLVQGIGKAMAEGSRNDFAIAAPSSFNPNTLEDQNKNFERYYTHPSYSKLGYNPWADNEANYNAHSSGLGDLWRSTKAMGRMLSTGFTSPLRSYADIASGDFLKGDEDSAEAMKRLNVIGSSTRGGALGFTSNIAVSSGYTIGLLGEMGAEMFLAGLVAPETGGASIAAGAGKWTKTLGTWWKNLGNVGEAVKSMKNFGEADVVWKAIKTGAEFVNPLGNTFDVIKAVKGSENLSNLAKISKTAGGFYKDVRDANYVLSEAKMEGASASADVEEQLIAEYKRLGKFPTAQDLLDIKEKASDAGLATTIANLPTIFLTNKITFAPLFKPVKAPGQFVLRNGVKFMEKEGEGLVEATFKNRFKSALSPKNLWKAPVRYFGENLSEGFQEVSQDVISGTAKDFYTNQYKGDNYASLGYAQGQYTNNNVWDALAKNTTDQFSGKGFETFASGFFMGGLVKVVTSPIHAAIDGVKGYKKDKSEYTKKSLDTLNAIYKDPLKYFGANILNYTTSTDAVTKQAESEKEGDTKDWLDHENSNLMSQVMTALDTDTYDVFLDKLKDIKTMTPQAIKDAYGMDGQEVIGKIDKIISRAEQVKSNYEEWTAKVENPYNPKQYKTGSVEYNKEALNYVSWENAKKWAVFNQSSLERNLDRIQGLVGDILATPELSKLNANDVSILMHPHEIEHELKMLSDEVEVMQNGLLPANKQEFAIKKAKQKKLQTFYDNLYGHYLAQSTPGVTEEKINRSQEKLKKSYVDYIGQLATSQTSIAPVTTLNLDKSFQQLLDLHDLKQDNLLYANIVNTLATPKGYFELHERLNKTFKDLYESRQDIWKAGIERMQGRAEDNSILNILFNKGIVLEPKAADQLLKEKIYPKEYYDTATKEVINERSPERYAELNALVTPYIQATKAEEPVAAPEANPATSEFTSKNEPEQTVKTTEKPQETSKVSYKITDRFNEVKNGKQLKELEEELLDLMATTTLAEREELGITTDIVLDLISKKEAELSDVVDISTLEVGNIVSMYDSSYGDMCVTAIRNGEVTLRPIGDPTTKMTIAEENIKKNIKFKYSDKMEVPQKKAGPEEVTKVTENLKAEEKFLENKEAVAEVLEQAFEDEAKFNNDFLNNLGCD